MDANSKTENQIQFGPNFWNQTNKIKQQNFTAAEALNNNYVIKSAQLITITFILKNFSRFFFLFPLLYLEVTFLKKYSYGIS